MEELERLREENKKLLGLRFFLMGAYGTADTSEISEIMGRDKMVLVSAAVYIDELEKALRSCSGELHHCIGKINDNLKAGISSSDLDPPEYYDYQTVHDADKLLDKPVEQSLVEHNVSLIEEFCAYLKSDHYLDKQTHDGAIKFIDKIINS